MNNQKQVIRCNRCSGKGYTTDTGKQLFATIGTAGIFPFMDCIFRQSKRDSIFSDECSKCNGNGYVLINCR